MKRILGLLMAAALGLAMLPPVIGCGRRCRADFAAQAQAAAAC